MKKISFIILVCLAVPMFALAQGTTGPAGSASEPAVSTTDAGNTSTPVKLKNPLKADSFEGLFRNILKDVIIPVTATLGVIFIIWAGFMFVTAQGNPEKVTAAKKRLMYVLIGVGIIIASEIILDLLLNTLTQIADVNPIN